MDEFLPENLFDLRDFEHTPLFATPAPAWEALKEVMDEYLAGWDHWERLSNPSPDAHLLEGPVFIGAGCRIEPGVVIRGPAIIGNGTEIRTGAYLRGGVIIGQGCVIGAHSEIKRAILLDGAKAPHQNYVGDSVLGRDVNLGAGTILSNVKNIGREVSFWRSEELIRTGLRKLGAILGDGCRTGCNTVLNPGVVMAKGCVTYPNVSLRSGYYPPRTVIKLRQAQQQVCLDRLAGRR